MSSPAIGLQDIGILFSDCRCPSVCPWL